MSTVRATRRSVGRDALLGEPAPRPARPARRTRPRIGAARPADSGSSRVVAKSARRSVSSRPMAHRMPGLRGTSTRRDVELAREPRGMQRPGAAERDQRVVARIVAALHRDDADRPRHVGGDDGDDALRRRHQRPCRAAPPAARSRPRARSWPHRHAAAEQMRRVQRLQHDVGVGHGRLVVAAVVADRAGIGAGAARPDLQQPAAIDIGDRAAAGADGVDVEHRRLDRIAVHHGLAGQPALAVLRAAPRRCRCRPCRR